MSALNHSRSLNASSFAVEALESRLLLSAVPAPDPNLNQASSTPHLIVPALGAAQQTAASTDANAGSSLFS
ncbi:MAG TPA: LEPR-XLL domain-containing protein, partial [Rariglobus sp.]